MKSDIKFVEHLRRQLAFIGRSCASFDAGHKDESIRIATCIRVLVHDTHKSTSLLKHLDALSVKLMSSVPITNNKMDFAFDGLTTWTSSGPVAEFRPDTAHPLAISRWWSQIIYKTDQKTEITRKILVLSAANKDGGAHVDRELDPEYKSLMSFWTRMVQTDIGVVSTPIQEIHLIGLRRLGAEILLSEELLAIAKTG